MSGERVRAVGFGPYSHLKLEIISGPIIYTLKLLSSLSNHIMLEIDC